MATTDILPTSILQVTPSSCENCTQSSEIGLNPNPKSSFFTHLESLLRQYSEVNDGEYLPDGGNILPQNLLSFVNQVNSSELHPLVTAITEDIQETAVVLEQAVNHYEVELTPKQLQLLTTVSTSEVNDLDISPLVDNEKLQNINTPVDILLRDLKQSRHLDIPENLTQLQREHPQRAILAESVHDKPAIIKQEAILQENSKINSLPHEKLNINTSIEENNFKALPSNHFTQGTNEFEQLSLKQAFEKEILHQATSTYKSNTTTQHINPIYTYDVAQRLNNVSTVNHFIETPIPINLSQSIKEGVNVLSQSIDQSIYNNIKWLIGNKIQNANINVYPESLGHVNVALNLEESRLTINFLANTNVVKEIIEANLLNLKDQLNESGLNLQEVNVSSRFSNYADSHTSNDNSHENPKESYLLKSDEKEDTHLSEQQVIETSSHLIDAFA